MPTLITNKNYYYQLHSKNNPDGKLNGGMTTATSGRSQIYDVPDLTNYCVLPNCVGAPRGRYVELTNGNQNCK